MNKTTFEILLVEDNPGDQRLVQEALKENGLDYSLRIAGNGVQALEYLRRVGDFVEAHRPDLVLLDLNLPKMGGREVLAEMKADDALRRLPVVVMTTSQAEDDILTVYRANGNCFVTKPMDLDEFLRLIKAIVTFWLSVARLPSGDQT